MRPSKTKVCKVNESCSIVDDDGDGDGDDDGDEHVYAWTHVRARINRRRKCQSAIIYTRYT